MISLSRLGFWNRLAIVASALALVVLPIWAVVDTNNSAADIAGTGYQICTSAAEARPNYDAFATSKECMAKFSRDFDKMKAGWTAYGEGLLFTAALCVVLYLLIWGIAATAKWVWRGRGNHKSTA